MASSPEGRRLTEQHRLAQIRIAQLTTAQMLHLWRIIDPAALATTSAAWLAAALQLVQGSHRASAGISRSYYQALRQAEVGAPLRATVGAPAFDVRAARTSLFVTGPISIKRAMTRGVDLAAAANTAQASSAASSARQALAGGRRTLLDLARADDQAVGFTRVTSGNACEFCQMLADRGAVYFSEDSAGFEAHDRCNCEPEPVFAS